MHTLHANTLAAVTDFNEIEGKEWNRDLFPMFANEWANNSNTYEQIENVAYMHNGMLLRQKK